VTGYGLLIGRNAGTLGSRQYERPCDVTGKLDKVENRVSDPQAAHVAGAIDFVVGSECDGLQQPILKLHKPSADG